MRLHLYSQESEDHIRRVLTLVQWLRSHGVDAYVDKFEQSPPQSCQLWCYEQLKKASYVLVVCTEEYERRILREEDEGVGRGATWEGAIISSEIYDKTHGQSKYIPVVFSNDDVAHVPFFLTGSTFYNVGDEESLNDLYRRMTDQPEYVPAPLGEVMELPQDQLETQLPVVPIPPPAAAPSQPEASAQPEPPAAVGLADVIEGEWAVQIQSPVLGTQVMRITMTPGQFQASAMVGPPGWEATGTWQTLPGEQLVLQGVQVMTQPFPQQGPYQAFNQFFSITPSELHGTSGAQESVIWRRT